LNAKESVFNRGPGKTFKKDFKIMPVGIAEAGRLEIVPFVYEITTAGADMP